MKELFLAFTFGNTHTQINAQNNCVGPASKNTVISMIEIPHPPTPPEKKITTLWAETELTLINGFDFYVCMPANSFKHHC